MIKYRDFNNCHDCSFIEFDFDEQTKLSVLGTDYIMPVIMMESNLPRLCIYGRYDKETQLGDITVYPVIFTSIRQAEIYDVVEPVWVGGERSARILKVPVAKISLEGDLESCNKKFNKFLHTIDVDINSNPWDEDDMYIRFHLDDLHCQMDFDDCYGYIEVDPDGAFEIYSGWTDRITGRILSDDQAEIYARRAKVEYGIKCGYQLVDLNLDRSIICAVQRIGYDQIR